MLINTHTHTAYSFDGRAPIEAVCNAAYNEGVGILAITDHAEAMVGRAFDEKEKRHWDAHRDEILSARERFSGRLKLLYGCELGQPHLSPDYARAMLNNYDYDYVIGSLHYYDGNLDIYDVNYTRENSDEYLRRYFTDIIRTINFGGFQSLGHLDYILRRMQDCFDGAPTFAGYEDYIDTILSLIIEKNIALEINTSSLYKWMKSISLEKSIIEKYRRLGGRALTLGSDAHYLEHIAVGLSQGCALARECGFNALTYYENKQPKEILL